MDKSGKSPSAAPRGLPCNAECLPYAQSMKRFAIAFSAILLATLTACSSSTSTDTPEVLPKSTATPAEAFVNTLKSNFDDRLQWWSTATGVNDQALAKFISSIDVTTDDSFTVVTISANAQIGGDNADLSMGSLVGTQIDNVNGLQAAVYCAGKTWPNDDDTFNNFVKTLAVDFEINDDMKALQFPAEGIIIKMIWSKSTTKTDDYGNEEVNLSPIGTDQVGISTANFKKIADAYNANYRKLSDIAPVKYSKNSWYSGLCAIGQSQNN
jgi:hypothetical protein